MSELAIIDSVNGISICSVEGSPSSFVFKSGFMINADGSPNAYAPDDIGLDWLANAGYPGNWWGIATDGGGEPYIQEIYDPTPGFYVSTTALLNPAYPQWSPYRFSDSESIPFFVLPGNHSNGAELGDIGLVLNTQTNDNCFACYADIGPQDKIGEGSIRLAEALNINSDPKKGGIESKVIVTLVFPGSVGKWMRPDLWWDLAHETVLEWGGLSRLREIAKSL